MFHVSLLKKKIGKKSTLVFQLPDTDKKGQLRVELVALLNRRMVKKKNATVAQWLIQWWGTDPTKAT